jgi:hypothetical protein
VTGLRGYAFVVSAVIALCIAGAFRWRSVSSFASPRSISMESVFEASSDSVDEMLATAEDLTVTNDPFRLANTPAAVRFDPNDEMGAVGPIVTLAPRIRPNMTLKAVIGGPPWQAIVDGIPGQAQGTLVRPGSVFDKLVARAVTRDSVVIQGPDTTWVLAFGRRP